jgi:predicted dehydrogenase
MKFGIVGLSLSHPYAFADILIKQGHSISFVWDSNTDKSKEFAQRYNSTAVDDFSKITLEDADGVFIESESSLHCSFAKTFIEKKIPVFIDKVMALDISELDETIRLARENNTIVMSSSAIRFMPEYIKLREEIAEGKLGRVVAVSADVRHDMKGYLEEPNTWQDDPLASGGEIMNFGVHGIEPVYSMLGPGVEWVHCIKSKAVYDEALSEDMAFINIRFNNGSTGTVNLISCINDYGFSMKAYGTEGIREAGDTSSAAFDTDDQYGYERMLLEFAWGIENGKFPVPLDEIEELVKTLIAARISADENRVVYLKELDKQYRGESLLWH